MDTFEGRLAVITGAGSGMGRELAVQLAAAGCDLALCDLGEAALAATKERCAGVTVSTHACDVSDEAQVLAFRDAVLAGHGTEAVHLLFNNAGIAGGGSFVTDDRADWERTFNVDWYGVYYMCRAFLPALIAADAAHIVNTSSVNGFWASLGPRQAHTAYSAAKFAVKGFSEALVTDLRLHAPHVQVSVVMPGHVGTDIAANTLVAQGKGGPMALSAADVAKIRAQLVARGLPVDNVPDDAIRAAVQQRTEDFRDHAPTSAAAAATIILDGMKAGRWRILVGADAEAVDAAVRAAPEDAYEIEFAKALQAAGHFKFMQT
jgi:NAD(P)-dependent dehydrogenase (short-subunit alcohol dehydrogenase family)